MFFLIIIAFGLLLGSAPWSNSTPATLDPNPGDSQEGVSRADDEEYLNAIEAEYESLVREREETGII